jgi:hypothetical protein
MPTSEKVVTVGTLADERVAVNYTRTGLLLQNQSPTFQLLVRELRNPADVAAGTAGGTIGVLVYPGQSLISDTASVAYAMRALVGAVNVLVHEED